MGKAAVKQFLKCRTCRELRWINTIEADNDIAKLQLQCVACGTNEIVAARFAMEIIEIVSLTPS